MKARLSRWPNVLLLSLLFLLAVVCLAAFEKPRPAARPAQVRLAVVVVFDQLRGDYLERWQELFEDGGFRRMQDEGAWFTNCHYPYAQTVTAVGHASLLTGCCPERHGIVGNAWYDRSAGRAVYCVADRGEQVPPRSQIGLLDLVGLRESGSSPRALGSETVGDVLKRFTSGKAKVLGLSLKDRSAILMAGARADACFWLDNTTGRFVTSTYYRRDLPRWLREFNGARPADRWFGSSWARLRPELDYVLHSGPDDAPGEGVGFIQGRSFPHPLTGGLEQPGPTYYRAVETSPFGNDLLLELAKRAIRAEGLGQDDVPDLLCLSFSSNDLVGHVWGPDSQEVLDVTFRSDRIVRELLTFLDLEVGQGEYLVALTADHGVAPLPEVSQSRGIEADRIPPRLLTADAEEFLAETFGPPSGSARYIAWADCPWVCLNRPYLAQRRLDPGQVEEALARWLEKQPGILAAYTREQLALGPADAIGKKVRRSHRADRSGDVEVVLKPYHLCDGAFSTGTTHGTPHDYDTHVPLLVRGPGVEAGRRRQPVSPLAIAAIVAHVLGIPPPADAESPTPRGLFDERRLASQPRFAVSWGANEADRER